MAPTESKILSNYLLVPAQLPAIISLEEFIALFPRPMQSSSQIRSLYRDLQSQRNALADAVSADIENETKRGKAIRRAVIKEKRNADSQEYDDEVEIERMVSRPCCDAVPIRSPLTMDSSLGSSPSNLPNTPSAPSFQT